MTMQTIKLKDLSSAFTTRWRGQEAYAKLCPLLEDPTSQKILDLDYGIPRVSTSFLDELLLQLTEGEMLNSLFFRTSNRHTMDCLERVSSVRSWRLHLVDDDGAVRQVEQRPREPLTLGEVDRKPQKR